MSIHDVAAVDRLNSLKVSRSKSMRSNRPQPGAVRDGHNPSLPTSPVRDQKPNSDTLRQAMARHQVKVFTPQYISIHLNPSLFWTIYVPINVSEPPYLAGQLVKARVPPPELQWRHPRTQLSQEEQLPHQQTPLQSLSSSPERKVWRNWPYRLWSSNYRDRYRMVSSTGQRAIPATGSYSRLTPGDGTLKWTFKEFLR